MVALATEIAALQKQAIGSLISPANTQRFRHGKRWDHPSSPHISPGEVKQHSAYLEAKFEDLVKHDLSILPAALRDTAAAFQVQFMEMFVSTMNAACEESGNIVDAKAAGGAGPAFLQTLEKIEMSVDAQGRLRLPQILPGADAARQLQDLLNNASPEFKDQVDAILKRKAAAAVAKERERRLRFLSYGEEDE